MPEITCEEYAKQGHVVEAAGIKLEPATCVTPAREPVLKRSRVR
jgi:hypothetical protein